MASRVFKSSLAFLTLSLLAACGGGGSGDNSSKSTTKNQAPVLAQISSLDVKERDVFTITANASDSDGSISSYSWKQINGTTLELNVTDSATAEFVAPSIVEDESITVSVTATDNNGSSVTQEVSVHVSAYQNINQLTFEDPAFKKCLDDNEIDDVGHDSITCSNNLLTTLDDLSHFENLSQLNIQSNQLTNIDILTDNETIKHLELKNAPIEDLTPINTLEQLESLALYDAWNYSDWRSNSLAGLNFENQPRLVKLVVSNVNRYNSADFDAEKLTKAKGLSSLELTSIYLSNHDSLNNLNNLTLLSLDNSFNDFNSLSFLLNKDKITTLALKNISVTDFSALATLNNLEKLTIHSTNSTADYSAIYKLENIESLELLKRYHGNNVFSLDQVSSKENIKALKTINLTVDGVQSISEFVNLEELTLNNAGITSVFQISKLESLKYLDITNNYQLSDISPLIDLTGLTYLNLSSNRQVKELSALKNMTQLESLILSDANPYINLEALINLSSLKNIELTNSYQTSLDVLGNVTSLESIMIVNTYAIDTIGSLEKLVNLESIAVKGSELKDLSFIQDNLQLKLIDVNDNKIENLNGLKKLTKLEKLYLGNSPALKSLEVLLEHTELKELKISNNRFINSITALENTKKLELVKFSSISEIDDVSVLKNLDNLNHIELFSLASLLCESVNGLVESLPNIYIGYDSSSCVKKPINWDIIDSEQIRQCIKEGNRDINNIFGLTCSVDPITTLAGLEQFTKLEVMDLRGMEVELDFSPLSELPFFRSIGFDQYGLNILPDLRNLTNLKSLRLYGDSIDSFNATRLPSSIESITVNGDLTHLDFDKYLPNVINIDFDYNNITTVTGTENLPSLNRVSLDYNNLSSLNAFYDKSNLTRISIYGNSDLTCEDIKGLKANSPSVYITHWMSCN